MKKLLNMACRALLLPSLFCLILHGPVDAQQAGRWDKVQIGKYVPLDFSFSDSLNGILLCSEGIPASHLYTFITSDGGVTWKLGNDQDSVYGPSGVWPNVFQMVTPSTGYWGIASSPQSLPAGIVYQLEVKASGVAAQSSYIAESAHGKVVAPDGAFAQMLEDSLYGLQFVCDGNGLGELIATNDGWNTFRKTGCQYIPDADSEASQLLDAKIIDSTNIWLSLWNGRGSAWLSNTYNAGATWSVVSPILPRGGASVIWRHITLGPPSSPERPAIIYAVGGLWLPPVGGVSQYATDFAFSIDNGKTWSIDSTFPGGVYRLSAPEAGKIWCVVGANDVSSEMNDELLQSGFGSWFSDSLYYSSDYGKSWTVDASTFIGDTITEMHWFNANNGWISAVENGVVSMYRFVPSATAVAQKGEASIAITGFPNPCKDAFSITGASFDGKTKIYDVLGREYSPILKNGSTLDVSSLRTGVYEVVLQSGTAVRMVRE